MMHLYLIFIICCINHQIIIAGFFSSDNIGPEEGGVDISFPQHHYLDKTSWGGRKYQEFIEGCYKRYRKDLCDATEIARINQNFHQPPVEHNYTELGFKKMKVPDHVWEIVEDFWKNNKDKEQPEKWPAGNTYTNNWKQPTGMVSLENTALRGGDGTTKRKIWDGLRPILEQWVGQRLIDTSLYGIRVYKEGAVLSSHVDRLPLITSCIIHVDSEIKEPWPIEVISHDGKAYNVTMKPGEMVLYESHTVIHGRPFPFSGKFYANLFVHYAPVDHAKINEEDHKKVKNGISLSTKDKSLHTAVNSKDIHGNERYIKLEKSYREHQTLEKTRKIGGHEQANHESEQVNKILDEVGHKLKHPDANLHNILHTSRGNVVNERNDEKIKLYDDSIIGPKPPVQSPKDIQPSTGDNNYDNTRSAALEEAILHDEVKKVKELKEKEESLKAEEEKLELEIKEAKLKSTRKEQEEVNARLADLKRQEVEIERREEEERLKLLEDKKRLNEARARELSKAKELENTEFNSKETPVEPGDEIVSNNSVSDNSTSDNSDKDEDEEEGRLYTFLPLNEAAARGDTRTMKALLTAYPHVSKRKDVNGWTALHEAARAGSTEAVKMLVDHGAKLSAKTNRGESPLWWARRSLPEGHSLTNMLISLGAPETGGL